MVRIHLVRHGQTEWNTQKRYQGVTDIPLDCVGMKQAQIVGQRFASIPIDKVYTSPLKRALVTAQAIASAANVPVIEDDAFTEICFGYWEGKTVGELMETHKEEYTAFWNAPATATFPGEGSLANVAKRVMKGVERIVKENDGKTLVIVSHGGLIRVIILSLMGLDLELYRRTWLDNTSISTVEIREKGNFLVTLNDKAHIDQAKFEGIL
ncbi:MAG: histidine phosphatase family protein [Clostridiales bacterium]|nr:histidine phosphatase family protein [Clostridiales bacterium]